MTKNFLKYIFPKIGIMLDFLLICLIQLFWAFANPETYIKYSVNLVKNLGAPGYDTSIKSQTDFVNTIKKFKNDFKKY